MCFHHGISSDTQICLIPFNASVVKTSATRLWFSIALALFLLIWILVLCLQAEARSCARLQPQSRCCRDDVAHLLTRCWLLSFVARHVAIALRPLLVLSFGRAVNPALSCFAWPLVRPSLPVCVGRRLSAPCPPPFSTSHNRQRPAERFERQLCLAGRLHCVLFGLRDNPVCSLAALGVPTVKDSRTPPPRKSGRVLWAVCV